MEPRDYDGRYVGEVTVRGAIEDSRNVPTVELAQRVGIGKVAELAHSAGLGEIPELPAVALGSVEVSLIDLVGAYTGLPEPRRDRSTRADPRRLRRRRSAVSRSTAGQASGHRGGELRDQSPP